MVHGYTPGAIHASAGPLNRFDIRGKAGGTQVATPYPMVPRVSVVTAIMTLCCACDGELASLIGQEFTEPSEPEVTRTEECDNGLDDNGDGEVDEGCPCKEGETQDCFPGLSLPHEGSPCRVGHQECETSGEFRAWGSCIDAIGPTEETCGDNIDQDCNGFDLPCDTGNFCDLFSAEADTRPVDIILVVDQSPSMEDEQRAIQSNINYFSASIAARQIDYHVVVIATRGGFDGFFPLCIPEPLAQSGCQDNDRFRQVDVPVHSHNSLQITVDHWGEFEGFLRPGSLRHFIEVSDDDSDLPANIFDAFIRGKRGFSDYVFHSIVATHLIDSFSCADDVGSQYLRLSQQTGGITVNICNANWRDVFRSLETEVTKVKSQFTLTHTPQINTIAVTLNGAAAIEGMDFTLNRGIPAITFSSTPPAGSMIRACYDH